MSNLGHELRVIVEDSRKPERAHVENLVYSMPDLMRAAAKKGKGCYTVRVDRKYECIYVWRLLSSWADNNDLKISKPYLPLNIMEDWECSLTW